jgi:putative membrane protein insertion efficiency factor
MRCKIKGSERAVNKYSALELFPYYGGELYVAERPEAPLLPWWINPLSWMALSMIYVYRRLIPHNWKRVCIYQPTCSAYGVISIKKYGLLRGIIHTFCRIHRCNGSKYLGGADPP